MKLGQRAKQKDFICHCFFTRNLFIKNYKVHVTYENDEQFHQDFRQVIFMFVS